jgi:hypothetical protein
MSAFNLSHKIPIPYTLDRIELLDTLISNLLTQHMMSIYVYHLLFQR